MISLKNLNKSTGCINRESPHEVSLVFSPVQQHKFNISNKRPLQLVIIITCHEFDINWNVRILTTTTTIGKHYKTHFVAMLVSVKWRAAEYVVKLLALWEFTQCEFTHKLGDIAGILPMVVVVVKIVMMTSCNGRLLEMLNLCCWTGEKTRDTSWGLSRLMQPVDLFKFFKEIMDSVGDILSSSQSFPYPTTALPTQSICKMIAYDSEPAWSMSDFPVCFLCLIALYCFGELQF